MLDTYFLFLYRAFFATSARVIGDVEASGVETENV
jgi:hypothetical protein